MNQAVLVQELVIVLAVANHQPMMLTPDFLKYSGIVPAEWELAQPPIYTKALVQLVYRNGVRIVAEPERVIFIEAIVEQATVAILGLARQYVQTLPNMDYQAVGLNPIGYVSFDSQPDAARKYLRETLLSPGPWQEVGTAPVRATLNLSYQLERSQFHLSISEATWRRQDETTIPVAMFSGNFSYDLTNQMRSERLLSLQQILDNWQADLQTYKDIVNTKFLSRVSENQTVIPDLFAMSARA